MWQFICGFSLGVYVGTIYNCEQYIKHVQSWVKTNVVLPEKKEESK